MYQELLYWRGLEISNTLKLQKEQRCSEVPDANPGRAPICHAGSNAVIKMGDRLADLCGKIVYFYKKYSSVKDDKHLV